MFVFKRSIPSLRSIKGSAISFSIFSKSSLNAHSFKRAESSLIDERVKRNCSAVPRGNSGFKFFASIILSRSSSVGNMFKSFSIPSLVTTVESIFKIAILMALGGGSFVIAILIAFERLWSNTIISLLLLNSCCFY